MFTELKPRFYYQMLLVRLFEERVFELFTKGELFGTTHACIGQEANAVAVINHLNDNDIIVSNHRCHGHYLVRTGDVKGLLAELMGKSGGVCGGRGGSQHLCKDNFYTNGIQGSMVPIAAGMALAEKKKQSNAITVLFIGDGTFGEGIVYETFNMISLWQVPILVVVENNFYAQTTPISLNTAGSLSNRAKAFNISVDEVRSNDVVVLYRLFDEIVRVVREKKQPHVQIIHTYRLCPHSKGDDYRSREEIGEWEKSDPLKILGQQLTSDIKLQSEKEVDKKIKQAESEAREMTFPVLR